MSQPEQQTYSDPDPFVVVSVWIAAAALALQFVQVARDFGADSSHDGRVKINTPIAQALEELEQLKAHLKRLSRAIDKGAKDPEREFYDVKFGISLGILKLEANHHREYADKLHWSFAKIGALSVWINYIIREYPEAAVIIGSELKDVADSAEEINSLIASGAPNRRILAECRKVLDELQIILENITGVEN